MPNNSDVLILLNHELEAARGEYDAYHYARASKANLVEIDKRIHDLEISPETPFNKSFLLGLENSKKIIYEAGKSGTSFQSSVQYPTKAEFDLYWQAQPFAGEIDGLSFAISNLQQEKIKIEIQRVENVINNYESYNTKTGPGVYQRGYLSGLKLAQRILTNKNQH
jgi:hypothetical protein